MISTTSVKSRKLNNDTFKFDKNKKVGRREITQKLTEACSHYWVKKLYSVHTEVGVEAWGRRRIDVMALNTKAQLIGVEIKSGLEDYRADKKKWTTYIPYVNKFYFLFSEKLYRSKAFDTIEADTKEYGVGIMVLNEYTGHVEVVRNAKKRIMENKNAKKRIILKMAWRGGASRYNTKRIRQTNIYD